ncbi:MAG: hypothetical protein AB1726_18770 [Planctomycetota bacterium]
MLAIAQLYPADHSRFAAVVEPLLERLRRRRGAGPSLSIEVGSDHLRVDSTTIGLDSREARSIHTVLWFLGASHLAIEARASPRDLHWLASSLVAFVRQNRSAAGGSPSALGDPPAAIHLAYREFGRRVSGADARVLARDLLPVAVQRIETCLRGTHQSPEIVDRACRSARQLLGRVAEKLETGAGAQNLRRAIGGRSLERALDLCASAITAALEDAAVAGTDFEDLSGLFQATETALALSDDRETMQLMLNVLRQARAEASKAAERSGAGSRDPSPADLEHALREMVERGGPPGALRREDAGAPLPALLHLLLDSPSPRQLVGISHALRAVHEERRDPGPSAVLRGFFATVIQRADRQLVDRALPLVADAFCPADPHLVAALLISIGENPVSPETVAILWPHLLNELLRGAIDGQRELARRSIEVFGTIDPQTLANEADRVARLSSLRSGEISPHAFATADPFLLPVLAIVLERTDHAVLGQWVRRSLRENPPSWAGAEALHALREHDPRANPFLVQVLREGLHCSPSPRLQAMAASLIAGDLAHLPRSHRGEPWVLGAIQALASLPEEHGRDILRFIRGERRLVFWPAWPRACRKAARRALQGFRAARQP